MTAQRYERIPAWTRGDRLRKARQLTGLNTRDFAEAIGVSQKTVNNAESDAHDVRKIVLNAWAMATGISAVWLETGEGAVDSPDPSSSPSPSDGLSQLTAAKRRRTRSGEPTAGYPAAA